MKILHSILIAAWFLIAPNLAPAQSRTVPYDSLLAQKLGADDYGMKRYVLVLLKTGSEKNLPKATVDSLFRGHLDNINRLADQGKLVVAGPFFKNDQYRGIFILNAKTLEEGKALVETDPAFKAKLLDADFLLWYGSAALRETLEVHKRIEKKAP